MKNVSWFLLFVFLSCACNSIAQDSLNYFLNNAQNSYQIEEFANAETLYRKALNQNIKSYDAQLGLANSIHKSERFVEAITAYNLAEELGGSSDVDLYFGRGAAKVFIQDYKGAIKDINKAINLDANNPKLYYYKGYSEAALGRFKTAIMDYTKAIELNPNYADAYYNRGAAKAELDNFEAGMMDFEEAIEKNPEIENGLINIALSKLGMENYEGAIEDLSKVIEKRDQNLARAYFYRGEAYYELKQKDKSCIDWSKSSNLGYDLATDNFKDFCNSSNSKPKRDIQIVF